MSSSASASAPYFTVEPRSSVVRSAGTVSLLCTASSTASRHSVAESDEPTHHDMTITWTHNGVALDNQSAAVSSSSSSSSVSSRVYMSSFSHADEGLYQCIANNSLGAVISRPASLHLARQFIVIFILLFQL